MTIGTPLNLGSFANASTATGATGASPNAITAGDCSILIHYSNINGGTITGTPTDTAGNSYTKVANQNAAPIYEVFICPNALGMTAGGSISANFSGGNNRHGLAAITVPGLIPSLSCFDPRAVGATGTANSLSATLLPIGGDLMFNLGFVVSASALGTFTPGGSWIAIGGSAATAIVLPFYQITTNFTASLVANPGWVNSVNSRLAAMAFKGLPASNTVYPSGTLTGFGA